MKALCKCLAFTDTTYIVLKFCYRVISFSLLSFQNLPLVCIIQPGLETLGWIYLGQTVNSNLTPFSTSTLVLLINTLILISEYSETVYF